MNILFIRSNPVNPDSRVEKEAQSLMSNGHSVSILCWDRDSNYSIRRDTKKLIFDECDRYSIGIKSMYGGGMKKNFIPLIKFQIEIMKFLIKNKRKYDVIHACDFDTGFISYLFKGKCKFVYDIFDYYIDSFRVPFVFKNIICKLEDYICNHANALILCTEDRKKQVRSLKQKNVYIIHNSPTKVMKKDYHLSFSEKIKIVYIGILGNGRMIKEIIKFVDEHDKYELHIAGFGNLETYIEEKRKMNKRIIYYGRIPYDKTLYIEEKCDIMTGLYDPNVPNHIFAAPNKFYESLCLGKPIIMIKKTGMAMDVEKFNTGITIDFSYDELERALLTIGKNIENWKIQSDRIKKIYAEKYSWEKMEQKLVSCYNNLRDGEK